MIARGKRGPEREVAAEPCGCMVLRIIGLELGLHKRKWESLSDWMN